MKKVNFLFVLGAAALMSSCGGYTPKAVTLGDMNDSLNYTLGLANGDGIKSYYLQNDSTGEGMAELLDALMAAYNAKGDDAESTNELFELGKQIGSSLKMQEEQGLIGNKDLEFNTALVMQGIVNGLNDFGQGMKAEDARAYFQSAIEELRAAAAAKATAEAAATEEVKAEGCPSGCDEH